LGVPKVPSWNFGSRLEGRVRRLTADGSGLYPALGLLGLCPTSLQADRMGGHTSVMNHQGYERNIVQRRDKHRTYKKALKSIATRPFKSGGYAVSGLVRRRPMAPYVMKCQAGTNQSHSCRVFQGACALLIQRLMLQGVSLKDVPCVESPGLARRPQCRSHLVVPSRSHRVKRLFLLPAATINLRQHRSQMAA